MTRVNIWNFSSTYSISLDINVEEHRDKHVKSGHKRKRLTKIIEEFCKRIRMAFFRGQLLKKLKIGKKMTFTQWFRDLIIERGLLPACEIKLLQMQHILFRPEIRKCLRYDDERESQHLTIYYIAPISPREVFIEPWNDQRVFKIASWASKDSLNRIYVDAVENQALNIQELPAISRAFEPGQNPPKYTIANGIHRFDYASKMNISSILSLIADTIIIRADWVRSVMPELEMLHNTITSSNE